MKTLQLTRTLRAGTALRALALIGAGAGAILGAAPAAAQTYTDGAVSGTVVDESTGAPVSGATVTLLSTEAGFERTTTTGTNGSFRFTGLAPGNYDVTVTSSSFPSWKAEGVKVLPSQTAALDVSLGGEEIVVTGASVQTAFSGTTTGLNVDVAELVKTTPIGRDLTSVVLLAPGTSQGDSTFGNLASIGGSSVAENAYYINGLNITNFDNYLGSARVPFEFYRTVEVKSGGYPAEFGRATGGIINAVSKAGSNDFTAAIHLNWIPNFARSAGKDLQYYNSSAGGLRNSTDRAHDTASSYSAIVEVGGPVIRDRLFFYGLAEFRREQSVTNSLSGASAFKYNNDDPFWGVKIDAYPIDNHHLEFTIFDTRNTTYRDTLSYAGNGVYGLASSTDSFHSGGVNYVGKYTGQFTDWLTISAAYGRMQDRFDNVGIAGASGSPYYANGSGVTINGVSSGGFYNGQRSTSVTTPYNTERKFYRADADLFFNLFGDHHVRFGFDRENNTLLKSSVRTGNTFLAGAGFLSSAALNAGGGGAGAALIFRGATSAAGTTNGVAIPAGALEINYFNSGGSFDAQNTAFYIQDEWRVTDRLTANLGVRRDDFAVDRADGVTLVNLDKNYGLRLGASYEIFSDHSGKFYGSYGTYYLPFASNTAFRMTGSEIYFRERWNYSGFASNGLPNLTTQVTNNASYQSTCPFGLTPLSSGNYCSVTGDGSVASADALIAHNLKATKENEWIVGYEQKLGAWTVGISYTHRDLANTAEDAAIDAAVNAYCTANGISGCSSTWTGFHQYVIINPGKDVVVNLDGLDGREVTFTAAELGYGSAKRTYDAVDVTFSRKWDGSWSLGGSYTWSSSKGNSEGFVQSDFGQSDSGITQDFDQPGFVDYSYGYLPNHRRHRIKLWGSVAVTDDIILGSQVQIQSPRKMSCFGYHPTDPYANVYGAASHYCGGTPSPRGTAQESDWISTINISGRYTLHFGDQSVTLRADVFNLLNSQGITDRNEVGELGVGTPSPTYGIPTGYQTPRYLRLGADIAF